MPHPWSLRSMGTWLAAAATLVFVLADQLVPFSSFRRSSTHGRDQIATKGLHLVVPTTKETIGLCRLMATSAFNGFPDAVLVGWDGAAKKDSLTRQADSSRLPEIFYYLNTLRADQDNDIVLLIDATQLWLQLPPQVLLERYFQAIEKQDDRLEDQDILGRAGTGQEPTRNTILFGADTRCLPQLSDKEMRCQYTPDNPLADDVYGPRTAGPRFLNAGTAIGPVKDLRNLFGAVMKAIEDESNREFLHGASDQQHIATMWARQEKARSQLTGNSTVEIISDEFHEHHIAIDHDSDVFMLSNWSQPYTVWMTYNHSVNDNSPAPQKLVHDLSRLDRLRLGAEFASLQQPFPNIAGNVSMPQHLTWADVILGTNTIFGKAFPIYHLTEMTDALEARWRRMWFHPHGRALLKAQRSRRVAATSKHAHAEAVVAEVRGVRYTTVHAHRGNRQQNSRARDWRNSHGGAWSDVGKYMTWHKLCAEHEANVFVD